MNIQSTLHGYRVQFLYTLYRMMLSDNAQEVFMPEGKEDLDIYVEGILTECIQVKCHKERLTYSDLYSSGKNTSLYRRALESLSADSAVKVKVVSINGGISDELTDKATLKRILKADPLLKLKESNAKRLANIIDAAVFEEKKMLSVIEFELKSRFVEVNPVLGVRLLTEWIYEAAEHGERLTIHDLEQEILAIVVFQSLIQAFHHQLGYAIVPLFTDNSLIDCDEQTLSNAFYDGVSARPEHIVAGLDIERRETSNDVETAFRKSNIVIVHGLSGAGKSAFAYRYIYENASAIAYEIRNCSSNNVNDVLASLSAITNGLRISTLFYCALKLTIWTCNKLTSIYDQINEDDSIAKKIFEDYRLLCEKRILEVDTSIFDVLSAIEIQDCVVRDSIRDAIEILKQFITSIELNPNWFVGSDILKEVFDHINDMKMYAQMQLLSGKKLN